MPRRSSEWISLLGPAAALATRFGALASLPARTAVEELLEDTQTKSARQTPDNHSLRFEIAA